MSMSLREIEIPEQFFKDNPLPGITAAAMSIFQMDMMKSNSLMESVLTIANEAFPEDRKKEIDEDRDYLLSLSTPDELFNYMRKRCEPVNRHILCRKALEKEDEILPELIRKWKRNGGDMFCESAALISSQAKEKYIDRIVDEFEEFQKPYGIYTCCTLLAFRNRTDALPKIMKAYKMMHSRSNLVSVDYDKGPLYAIYTLTGHEVPRYENDE